MFRYFTVCFVLSSYFGCSVHFEKGTFADGRHGYRSPAEADEGDAGYSNLTRPQKQMLMAVWQFWITICEAFSMLDNTGFVAFGRYDCVAIKERGLYPDDEL